MLITSFLAIVDLHGAGILHTNISEANMLVERADNAQGILVGFELAILEQRSSQDDESRPGSTAGSQSNAAGIDDSRELGRSDAMYRAASNAATPHVAFLARDRCSDRPPAHQYQHDLESFVWSFFFVQSCFRNGRRIFSAQVETWYTGCWDMIRLEKFRFLTAEAEVSKFARQFAESLGVGSGPLELCSRALAAQLRQPELDPLRLLSTLKVARDAYAESL
jgi:hypothetical protein